MKKFRGYIVTEHFQIDAGRHKFVNEELTVPVGAPVQWNWLILRNDTFLCFFFQMFQSL